MSNRLLCILMAGAGAAVCAGCDHATPFIGARDAAEPDAGAASCAAQFSGNFAEVATADACATLTTDGSGDTLLDLAIPSAMLAPGVSAAFGLGLSPSPGMYSSESLALWSARGVQTVGTGACVYNAGATAVPPGYFAMTLDSLDAVAGAAHGSLSMTLWVLAYPGTNCGAGETEQVELQF